MTDGFERDTGRERNFRGEGMPCHMENKPLLYPTD